MTETTQTLTPKQAMALMLSFLAIVFSLIAVFRSLRRN